MPAGVTLFTVVWIVHTMDKLFGFRIPGLGLLITIGLVIFLGMLLSSVLGRHLYEYVEDLIGRIPGVRAVYKTIKAITEAFSPESRSSFRRVVLVEYPHPGALSLGFVTKELSLDLPGAGPERVAAVYVPTNHLYIGNTVLVSESKVRATSLTVPEAVQIVLAAGASFPDRIATGSPPRP
jgi:uncharacterized membrane protein